jgi:hypothetical protein
MLEYLEILLVGLANKHLTSDRCGVAAAVNSVSANVSRRFPLLFSVTHILKHYVPSKLGQPQKLMALYRQLQDLV